MLLIVGKTMNDNDGDRIYCGVGEGANMSLLLTHKLL